MSEGNSSAAYDRLGRGYGSQRQQDARIYRQICNALADCRSVLNVGAGTGSYEPQDLPVVAVEPAMQMIRQRRKLGNAVQAVAESLPFGDDSFDAVLAVLTVHHWSDLARGLGECARVARRKVVLLTWDPVSPDFWLTRDYFPELARFDRGIFPGMEQLQQLLGPSEIEPVHIPADCVDGFLGAYWRRPEAYLRTEVRAGMSSFARCLNVSEGLQRLREDLDSGRWHLANASLDGLDSLDIGYRLVIAMCD